jgi:hypothetical protein
MGFLGLLIIIMLSPLLLVLAGIVFLFKKDEAGKRKGKIMLLIGIALILLEILIGNTVCSDMNFH